MFIPIVSLEAGASETLVCSRAKRARSELEALFAPRRVEGSQRNFLDSLPPVRQNQFRGVPPGKIDPFLIDGFVLGAQPFCSVKKTVQLMPEVGGRSIRMHLQVMSR